MSIKRINCIATPRNISTALMYSFAQRSDTRVVDEPFYAHYLQTSGRDHPGREAVLAAYETNAQRVQETWTSFREKPVLYLKNMAHHIRNLPFQWLDAYDNVLLIRDPKQLIASLAQVLPGPTMFDVGLEMQYEIFEYLDQRQLSVCVVDSGELLKNPESILTRLCDHLGLSMDRAMLSWEAGARPEDGNWAPYWYANLHKSTGFAPQKTSDRPLPEHCLPLYKEAQGYYNSLFPLAFKAP